MLNSSPKQNYGSINQQLNNDEQNEFTKSTDYYIPRKKSKKKELSTNRYKSDTFLNHMPPTTNIYNDLNVRRDSFRSIVLDNYEDEQDLLERRDDFSQTSTEIILSQSPCNCSYLVEPVAFIQNLATSIMGISLGQFIYNRILNRLIDEFNNKTNNSTDLIPLIINNITTTVAPITHLIRDSTNSTIIPSPSGSCQTSPIPINNNTDPTYGFDVLQNFFSKTTSTVINTLAAPSPYLLSNVNQSTNLYKSLPSFGISPDDFDRIRTQAQSETANLYFVSALFSGIPVIIMTNLLGVNCSTLGRKTLMLIYLFVMTFKFLLILLQCMNPDWPDWLFYLGAFIEGISGSGGVFYLSLYCYIADLTSPSSRSYRITLLNNLNSVASLCVTFACGYVIKYYGYFYLFLASLIFMFTSLIYTIFLIPEPLAELRDMTIFDRLKLCSIKRTLNCFKVYFSKEKDRCKKERESDSLLNDKKESNDIKDLRENNLDDNDNEDNDNNPKLSKQTFVLLLIVFANFIYNFGTIGIGSIFTLFIMNAPYCFDSVQISNYSVFSTVISLFMSLFVSKFVKINDLLICIFSVASYFASVLCYIFGNSIYHIYLGAVIASIAGLEYGYVRSIVSKSVEKNEVADALSLILIVDTFIAVVSSVIFPILYSSIVSKGISILFSFSNGFILIALICHIINYFLYKPVKLDEFKKEKSSHKKNKKRRSNGRMPPRYVSLSEDNLNISNQNIDNDILIHTAESMEISASRNAINNPHHSSIILS